MAFHVQTQRIVKRITPALDQSIPGFLEFRELLTRDAPEDELWLPACERSEDGEWTVSGFEAPDEPVAALPAE